jgi:AcrR family transcriptional regulator
MDMMRNGKKAREDHRVRYTRKILKDSLISLMKERSVTDIGIKEICARAEVSRSTFYVYYENVYDLLAEIEEEAFEYFNDLLNQIDVSVKHGSRKHLSAYKQKYLEFIADKDNPLQVLLSENGDINFQKRFFQKLIDQVRKIIQNTVKNPDAYIHEAYSVFYIHGAIGLIQYLLKNNTHIPNLTLAKVFDKMVQEIKL